METSKTDNKNVAKVVTNINPVQGIKYHYLLTRITSMRFHYIRNNTNKVL